MRVRCPNCSHPIELVNELDADRIACPSCGSHFQLSGSDEDTITAMFAGRVAALQCFRLLDSVGAGQYGRVWKAHDEELDRIVAVKIPHRGSMDPQDRALVIREARAVAQLNHPHIVRVYEVGHHENEIYIVSEYIDGVPLSNWWRAVNPDFRTTAQLCLTVAQAVEHAHEHGIIHRDLKPGNIVMDAQGQPHITDFGLAKREGADATIAVTGQILGTPAYMAPEQVGNAHQADRRSDVYSLGVILYELLCRQRPFGGGRSTLLHQLLYEEPPPLRAHNRRIPRDLETICLKALAKRPAERYQTAREMADDLGRFLSGEAIRGQRVSGPRRLARWAKRHPAASVAGLLAALVIALTGALLLRAPAATPASTTARSVRVTTLPPGAQVHLVPLHHLTQLPEPERGFAAGRSPVTVGCEPGDYLVVAYLNEQVFHEVYRHVPAEHEQLGGVYDHNGFRMEGDAVGWPPVQLFDTAEVNRDMALVTGGEFTMPTGDMAAATRVTVPDFHLDVTEVTVGQVKRAGLQLPDMMRADGEPDDDLPVYGLTWGDAMQLAERLGKRLPRDEALQYVSTQAGANMTGSGWQVVDARVPGLVHDPSFDRLQSPQLDREVIGLRSNVLEFTVNRYVGSQGLPGLYVRRGGYLVDARGHSSTRDANQPPPRYPHPSSVPDPKTGLRCVRSTGPSVTPQDFIHLQPLAP